MDYISVKEASSKFGISERRVQKLCEESRITGAQRISNVWIIPITAEKPVDERISAQPMDGDTLSLNELCSYLSISTATGRNWIKLNKITPTGFHENRPYFSRIYCEELKASILSGKNTALKSRRNKKYISGSYLYKDYVSSDSKNISIVDELLREIELSLSDSFDNLLNALLAECALQLIKQKNNITSESADHLLHAYLSGSFSTGKYDCLINDLIKSCDITTLEELSKLPCFRFQYTYEESEDILGLLYISCQNISNRKATGAYYTPTKVVKSLINHLSKNATLNSESRVLDPCSGSGNFLLQLPNTSVDNIYGTDIDDTSVMLTRLNMALKYPACEMDVLYNNFIVSDYFYYQRVGFDYIIGNPPWGFDYANEEKEVLHATFRTAIGKTVESYDLFIEQSLKKLNRGGILSFVLPEAILNVKIHQPVRDLILEGNSIQLIDYLGNAFDKVQCPCVILQLQHTEMPFDTTGMSVITKDSSFVINSKRPVSSDYFSFTICDDEYNILEKIISMDNCAYLKNHATFALGLVTGNNKKYISDTANIGYEMVLKGSDIYKYRKSLSNHYLLFEPNEFQQVAPIEYYRAPEKLLYRFVCNQLVFAYDDEQTLSLNSCNILIPKIDAVNTKYVLAILNSRVAQFIFNKRFQSVKVLRSHIEEIPIPIISKDNQARIVSLVDELISSEDSYTIDRIYENIDHEIQQLFHLNDEEYSRIVSSLVGENNFLH